MCDELLSRACSNRPERFPLQVFCRRIFPRSTDRLVAGTLKEPNRFKVVKHRSHAELIAEAQQALRAAKRLVDEQTAIVQRLERTGGCNSEAIDLLNHLRELLAAQERRLARVLSWPSWGNAA
jgi:hypothetical protein